MAEIYINGQGYSFEEGETILDVAKRNEVDIPVMCYLEHITPTGACRLCLVEVEGIDKPLAACVTYAMDGMKVKTDTDEVVKHRKRMMEFILIKHPLDCPVCDKAGECMLQDTAYSFGIKESVSSKKPDKPKFDWKMIIHDANLCVLCERCVKVCHEITGCSSLKIEDRGFNNLIVPSNGKNTLDCDFCGTCVDHCPVGALLDKPYKNSVRSWDLENIESNCVICPVGCKVSYGLNNGQIYRCTGTDESFVCSLGRYTFKYSDNPNRITSYMQKQDGKLADVSEGSFISAVKEKYNSVINRYGKESLAFMVSSRLSNEALVGYKHIAAELGIKNIISDIAFEDTGYYSEYSKKFGSLETFGTLEDIKKSDLVFVIGADIGREALGVKWRMMNSVIKNNAKLVTVGLKKYEYDYFTNVSILADYGDFAGALDKIKNSNDNVSSDIREYIKSASKISFIVGNEYRSAENQKSSVFEFLDFVGKDKLNAFINLTDRNNFAGTANFGLVASDKVDQLLKDMENGKIKGIISAGFYPFKTYGTYKRFNAALKNVELLVAADSFLNEFTEKADFLIPVTTHSEFSASFTTIDSRIIKTVKVKEAKGDAVSEICAAAMIGDAVGVKIDNNAENVFNSMVSGKFGYPQITFDEIDGCLYKEKNFVIADTQFKYNAQTKGTKEVFVNMKRHNGLLSVYARVVKEDDNTYRKYYFDADEKVTSGADACFGGSCVMVDDIAKGIVFIPKNNL